MTTTTHVILGGNGVAGRETAHALLRRGIEPTSVARSAPSIEGVRPLTADLLNPADAARALDGAEVAYLTVGLAYSAKVWEAQWPVLVRNTIDAAVANGTHLVFFDNVYAYGAVTEPMTESTPIAPTSKKGQVRAALLRQLDEAVANRGLIATVGRAADFYGPGATTSVATNFIAKPIARGKKGTWFFDADQPHSLTYTVDVGEGLAILGTEAAARGRTWHLPTAPALTGREYVHLAAGEDGRCSTMGLATLRIGGLFNSEARETIEMAYQYTSPYYFDSTAFETTFRFTPTSSEDGFAATVEAEKVS